MYVGRWFDMGCSLRLEGGCMYADGLTWVVPLDLRVGICMQWFDMGCSLRLEEIRGWGVYKQFDMGCSLRLEGGYM